MTFKEIQELIKLINKSELTEFKMKDGEFELVVRTRYYDRGKAIPAAVAAPQAIFPAAPVAQTYASPQAGPAMQAAQEEATEPEAARPESEGSAANYVPVKSPMVGTFYRSPSPDKAAYVKVGDRIEAGSVVCIIEAMKLFNEIESEVSGRIVKVLVEDAQPVEYDQVLFLVEPLG